MRTTRSASMAHGCACSFCTRRRGDDLIGDSPPGTGEILAPLATKEAADDGTCSKFNESSKFKFMYSTHIEARASSN